MASMYQLNITEVERVNCNLRYRPISDIFSFYGLTVTVTKYTHMLIGIMDFDKRAIG